MIFEILLSFLVLAIVYAHDELYLLDQTAFNRLRVYKKGWDTHFLINPLKGTIFGIWAHSILIAIIGYLAFGIVEDLIYQIRKKQLGLKFNWEEYTTTWFGLPRYYIINTMLIVILLIAYVRLGL